MELTAAMATTVGHLTAALEDLAMDASTDIAGTILGLVTTTRLAVASFVGLTITITAPVDAVADQVVLRLTLLEDDAGPGDVAASLVLPATSQGADPGRPGIQVVLYAVTPGAFVDLAADLAFLTGNNVDGADLDQHQNLAGEPDITRVIQDQSVIDQAIGVLIAGGHTREQAHAELDTLAEGRHTNRLTEATTLLTNLTPDRPDNELPNHLR